MPCVQVLLVVLPVYTPDSSNTRSNAGCRPTLILLKPYKKLRPSPKLRVSRALLELVRTVHGRPMHGGLSGVDLMIMADVNVSIMR